MIRDLKGIFSYFIFASIFIVLISIIFFFATKKYKKNKVKFFGLFTSLSTRDAILISSFILNFTIVVFFAVCPMYYNNYVMYMIIINSLISIITALNIHMILSLIIYSCISIFSLKIVNLVYNYLSSIYYDRLIFILGIIFCVMIIFYEMFVTFRLLEIVLKKNGGIKNARKSRK